jgi:hypothetical protein
MNPLITRLFPDVDMVRCFRLLVEANEKKTGKQAPAKYAEWFATMESTLNGQLLTAAEMEALEPIAIEAENEALWRVVPTAKVTEVKHATLLEFRSKPTI